jgi:hypothetical protein
MVRVCNSHAIGAVLRSLRGDATPLARCGLAGVACEKINRMRNVLRYGFNAKTVPQQSCPARGSPPARVVP